MSYDFAVIRPDLIASRAGAATIYEALRTEIGQPAAEGVSALVEELYDRCSFDGENSAFQLDAGWAPDARGTVITTSEESHLDVAAVLLEIARDHGFAVYDPQRQRLYDPRDRVDLEVTVGDGIRTPYVTERLIVELFESLDPDDPFIVIDRADEDYIQVYAEPGEPVIVEFRAGGADRHFQATTEDQALAQRVLWGWVTHTDDWSGQLAWEQIELD